MATRKGWLKRAVGNVVKETHNLATHTADQIKKAEKKVESNIKKAAGKAKQTLTKVGAGVQYAPLLPYFVPMKLVLNKKNIKHDGTLPDVAHKFYAMVVGKSNFDTAESFEASPLYSYNDDSYCYNDAGDYDVMYNVDEEAAPEAAPNNSVGKLVGSVAGAAVGAAAGVPPQVSGQVGAAAGGIVQGIIRWFGKLLKAKKEGKAGDMSDVADEANKQLATTTAEEAEALAGLTNEGGLSVGGMNISTTWLIVGAVVVAGGLFLIFRKK